MFLCKLSTNYSEISSISQSAILFAYIWDKCPCEQMSAKKCRTSETVNQLGDSYCKQIPTNHTMLILSALIIWLIIHCLEYVVTVQLSKLQIIKKNT